MNTNLRYRTAFLVCLACAGGLVGSLPETRAAGRNRVLSTPDLLVDLARDHGLRCRGKQTPADVLHIKTLLQAAARLDPRQTQACVWLYELASREGQPEEAAEMLAQLVAADPANTTALGNWLEAGAREAQTIEQRRAWLERLLAEQEQPEHRALVHAHLGRLALLQADPEQTRRHLDEARRLWPECPDAIVLGLELVTPAAPPAERLAAVLQALRANPVHVELAWEAGLLLDECGFADEAFAFYEHASSVHAAAGSGSALPSEKLLQLSRNALARKQIEDAVRYSQQAALAERTEQGGTYESRLYWYWLVAGRAPPAAVERFKVSLAKRFAAIEDPADSPVDSVAQAAWFYCIIDEQPQRALMLAEDAARRAPGDVFVARVLGWSQALNQQTDQAQQTLMPIAKTDPYAAYRLAQLLREAGDEDAPARVVRELAYMPPVGRARELLDELGVSGAATQPAEQRFPEIARLLAEFDREVLEFHTDSARFLEAAIRLEDPSLAPGEPWWAVFSLTNRGTFPITLGPDWLVNPVVLLSFQVEGDRDRDYPHLLTVSLDHARVIRPGETVRVRRTIDVGPLRKLARQTPQHLQSVSVTAILDPEQTLDGRWQPSATGQQLRRVSLVRLPANTSPEAWHARFSALKGDSDPARYQALEIMAQLLGEHQRARMKRLAYAPRTIPAVRVHRALLSALGSESWEVRVRALDALQVAGLNRALVDAAQRCLDHPHWLVRVMAVRLLARQGEAFAETARRIADEDRDELVRAMARSYVARWSSPQPRPATTQPRTQSKSGSGE